MSRHLLVGASLLVVLADLAQVALKPWEPALLAALGGAAIYSAVAFGAAREQRQAAAVAALMPAIPLGNIALWAATGSGVAPHAVMVAVLVLQIVAGGSGAYMLYSSAKAEGGASP